MEEHFYFFFPLLFSILIQRARLLRLFVAILCPLTLGARLVFVAHHPLIAEPQWHWITYYQTQYRVDAIAFGVLLALLLEVSFWRSLLCRLKSPLALGFGIAAICASLLWRDPTFRETLRYTIQAAAATVILYNLLFSEHICSRLITRLLNAPLLALIGKLSYSLYIWHFFANTLFAELLPVHLPIVLVVSLKFAASFAFAVASYYLLEVPFLALRRRFRTPKASWADGSGECRAEPSLRAR